MMTTRIVVGLTAGTCLIFSQNLMAEVSVFNPALLESTINPESIFASLIGQT